MHRENVLRSHLFSTVMESQAKSIISARAENSRLIFRMNVVVQRFLCKCLSLLTLERMCGPISSPSEDYLVQSPHLREIIWSSLLDYGRMCGPVFSLKGECVVPFSSREETGKISPSEGRKYWRYKAATFIVNTAFV